MAARDSDGREIQDCACKRVHCKRTRGNRTRRIRASLSSGLPGGFAGRIHERF